MHEIFREKINEIYQCFEDDLSKEIFADRMMYSLTGDYKYIMKLICRIEEGKEVYTRINKSNLPRVIFGAGIWGKNIIRAYGDTKFECFVDNNTTSDRKKYCGLPVISFEEYLNKYKNAIVIISSRLYHQEIYVQLIENGVLEENIVNAGKLIDEMSKRQYFDLPVLKEKQTENEVFVDGGSFDGRTSVAFKDWCNGNYKKVYAFEPDPNNQVKCKQLLSENCKNRYEIIPTGLWNEKTELCFEAISNGSSKVAEGGSIRINVACLDDMISDEVTFIKLDVEGSEYQAILGAQKTIKKYKPKLAISIYHKPEDIWELPELILSLNKNYRFYLRHYSTAASETVLYAI